MNYLLGIFQTSDTNLQVIYGIIVLYILKCPFNCIIVAQGSLYGSIPSIDCFYKIAYIIYMYAHVHFSPLLNIVGFHTWKVVTDKCIKTYIQFHFCLNLHGLIHKFAMIVVEFLVDNKWSTLNQYEFDFLFIGFRNNLILLKYWKRWYQLNLTFDHLSMSWPIKDVHIWLWLYHAQNIKYLSCVPQRVWTSVNVEVKLQNHLSLGTSNFGYG